jgi:membrane protease YdiL (CAAX protease family)
LREGLRTVDGRCMLALLYCGVLLTVLEYYYLPWRIQLRLDGTRRAISLEAGLTWAFATTAGYLVLPTIFVLFVHKEGLRSIGYRFRGFIRHAWIYLVLYAVMVPFILFAAGRADFQRTYPFVLNARHDWTTFLVWEASYLLQFFALEAFFRGYLLFTLERRFGWTAIFVMVVPYCMIHYHKPALEAFSALVAGVVLGALALRLRSFYGGVLLHGLVALTMDLLGAHASGLF